MNSVALEYFDLHMKKKSDQKCFLVNGTMLTGIITSFDETAILLKKTGTINPCLIMVDKIISLTPKD